MTGYDYDAVEAVVRHMIVVAAQRLDINPHALIAKIERLLDEELRRRSQGASSDAEPSVDPVETTWLAALESLAPDACENDLLEIVQELFKRLADAVEGTSAPPSLH